MVLLKEKQNTWSFLKTSLEFYNIAIRTRSSIPGYMCMHTYVCVCLHMHAREHTHTHIQKN